VNLKKLPPLPPVQEVAAVTEGQAGISHVPPMHGVGVALAEKLKKTAK
jgi:hypothetical protein